jgi:hypothetical protein
MDPSKMDVAVEKSSRTYFCSMDYAGDLAQIPPEKSSARLSPPPVLSKLFLDSSKPLLQ